MHTCTENNGSDNCEAAAPTTHDYGDTSERPVVDTYNLITLILFSTPESAGIARWHVKAALEYNDLGGYTEDAKIIVSELVTDAIQQAGDRAEKIIVVLLRIYNPDVIAVIVKDSSPCPPVKRKVSGHSEQGRRLQVIEALSWHWGWNPEEGGKEVFAVLERPNDSHRKRGHGGQIGDLG